MARIARHRTTRVAGVLLNRVAGPRHFEVLRKAVEKHAELPVFGYLPPDAGLEIPSLNSGLVAAEHIHSGQALLPPLVSKIEQSVDLERLLEAVSPGVEVNPPNPTPEPPDRVRIAVARDPAFHFYYEDNLTLLKAAGAEIVPFSPMRDPALPPDIGGIYLGGGIPESCTAVLERNQTMREAIRTAVASGLPMYAESGGMLYLSTNLVGTGIRAWEMCGVIPGEMRMVARFPSAAYVAAEAVRPSLLVRPGERYQGNEFRISAWSGTAGQGVGLEVSPPSGRGAPRGLREETRTRRSCIFILRRRLELPGRSSRRRGPLFRKEGRREFRKAKQRSRER